MSTIGTIAVLFALALVGYGFLTVWACCVVAKQADEQMETIVRELVRNGGIQ